MEVCGEPECKKKAKVVCTCSEVLFCNKHSVKHVREPGVHALEYLWVKVTDENKSAVIMKLLEFNKRIEITLKEMQSEVAKSIEKIRQDFCEVQKKLRDLQYQYLSAVCEVKRMQKVKRGAQEPHLIAVAKGVTEVERELQKMSPPGVNVLLNANDTFVKIFYSSQVSSERKTEIIKHLCQLNHNVVLVKYANYIKSESATIDILLEIIKDSAMDSSLQVPASRAFTVLSRINYDFSYQSFLNINIPGAEISNGIFTGTDLTNANLAGCKLNLSVLAPAKLNFKVLSSISEGKSKFIGHTSQITALKFSHDNSLLLSASTDKTLRVWETDSGFCKFIIEANLDTVLCIDISKTSSEFITGSADCTTRLFDRNTGICKFIYTEQKSSVTSVKFLKNDQLIAAGSEDCTVFIYQKSGEVLEKYFSSAAVTCMAVSPTPIEDLSWSIFFGNSNGDLKLWKLGANKVFWERPAAHSGKVIGVALTNRNKYAITAGTDGFVKVWGSYKGKKIATLGKLPICITEIQAGPEISCFVHSKKFKKILTVAQGKIKIWRVKNREKVAEIDLAFASRADFTDSYIAYNNENHIEFRDIYKFF